MFPAYNTLYVNLAPNNQRGTATSTYLTSWDIGIGLGISTGGYIAQQYAFDAVYLFGSILCVASMLFFNLYVSLITIAIKYVKTGFALFSCHFVSNHCHSCRLCNHKATNGI